MYIGRPLYSCIKWIPQLKPSLASTTKARKQVGEQVAFYNDKKEAKERARSAREALNNAGAFDDYQALEDACRAAEANKAVFVTLGGIGISKFW